MHSRRRLIIVNKMHKNVSGSHYSYEKRVSVIVSPSAPNKLHNMCNVISGVVARHEAIQGSKLRTLDCRASLATTDGETMTEAEKRDISHTIHMNNVISSAPVPSVQTILFHQIRHKSLKSHVKHVLSRWGTGGQCPSRNSTASCVSRWCHSSRFCVQVSSFLRPVKPAMDCFS